MEVLMNGNPGSPSWFPRAACTHHGDTPPGRANGCRPDVAIEAAARELHRNGFRAPSTSGDRQEATDREWSRAGREAAALRLEAARSARSVADGRGRKRGGALRRLMLAARREPRSSGRCAAKNYAASGKPFGRVARLTLWPVRLPSFPRSPPLPRSDETPSRKFPSPKREPGERPRLRGATLRT